MAEKERFELSLPLSSTTPLAGEPLRPLGYFSIAGFEGKVWRRERDSNPRCLSTSPVFKTGALNRSAISPRRLRQPFPELLSYYIRNEALCQWLNLFDFERAKMENLAKKQKDLD